MAWLPCYSTSAKGIRGVPDLRRTRKRILASSRADVNEVLEAAKQKTSLPQKSATLQADKPETIQSARVCRSPNPANYFVMPRSADSMNLIKVKTSSESERVSRIFSSACVVFSFDRSNSLYACSIDCMR